MKKVARLVIVLVLGLVIVGCGNKKKVETNHSNSEAISEEFTAKGEYKVGEDIEPGTYYIVLTDFENEDSSSESDISIELKNIDDKYIDTLFFSSEGSRERVKLEEGMIFEIYSYNTELFTLNFFNSEDYKTYQSENKNVSSENNSTATSSSSLESNETANGTNSSENVKVSELLSEYDAFIQEIKQTSDKVASMTDLEAMNAITDLVQKQAVLTSKLDKISSENLTEEENTSLMNKSIDMIQEYTKLMEKLESK